jgi:hypothetical protein
VAWGPALSAVTFWHRTPRRSKILKVSLAFQDVMTVDLPQLAGRVCFSAVGWLDW